MQGAGPRLWLAWARAHPTWKLTVGGVGCVRCATCPRQCYSSMVLSAKCSSQQQQAGTVCHYRYFLSANKKALAKFVKCVNWKAEVKAQQYMHVDF